MVQLYSWRPGRDTAPAQLYTHDQNRPEPVSTACRRQRDRRPGYPLVSIFCAQPEKMVPPRRVTVRTVWYHLPKRKFHHAVRALRATAAAEVADIIASFIRNHPATAYNQLKAAIPERTAATERTCIQQLLHTEDLSESPPSQLLHRMTQLFGSRALAVNGALLRKLFLQRLPANGQMVLATVSPMDLPSLASLPTR